MLAPFAVLRQLHPALPVAMQLYYAAVFALAVALCAAR